MSYSPIEPLKGAASYIGAALDKGAKIGRHAALGLTLAATGIMSTLNGCATVQKYNENDLLDARKTSRVQEPRELTPQEATGRSYQGPDYHSDPNDTNFGKGLEDAVEGVKTLENKIAKTMAEVGDIIPRQGDSKLVIVDGYDGKPEKRRTKIENPILVSMNFAEGDNYHGMGSNEEMVYVISKAVTDYFGGKDITIDALNLDPNETGGVYQILIAHEEGTTMNPYLAIHEIEWMDWKLNKKDFPGMTLFLGDYSPRVDHRTDPFRRLAEAFISTGIAAYKASTVYGQPELALGHVTKLGVLEFASMFLDHRSDEFAYYPDADLGSRLTLTNAEAFWKAFQIRDFGEDSQRSDVPLAAVLAKYDFGDQGKALAVIKSNTRELLNDPFIFNLAHVSRAGAVGYGIRMPGVKAGGNVLFETAANVAASQAGAHVERSLYEPPESDDVIIRPSVRLVIQPGGVRLVPYIVVIPEPCPTDTGGVEGDIDLDDAFGGGSGTGEGGEAQGEIDLGDAVQKAYRLLRH